VLGFRFIGLFVLQWIKIFLPYANIICVDVGEEALKFAGSIVKDIIPINASKENPVEAIKRITYNEGVKAIIDFVGSTQTVTTYIKAVSSLGSYILVGLLGARGLMLPTHSYF